MEEQLQESSSLDKALEDGPAKPYAGLRGRELVDWALRRGPDCVQGLGSMQIRYFEAVSRRAEIEWPKGFFASSIDDLMSR
jgi:hypothetical protein